MIVTPKQPPVQVKYRWDPTLIEEVKEIARQNNRTANETSESLMRWAVERYKAEREGLQAKGTSSSATRVEDDE